MKLARVERRWLETVFDAILPAGVLPGMPGAREVPLDRFVADIAAAAPARMLLGLRLALWFVWLLAPLLVLRRLRTFAGLSPDDRLAVLRGMRTSRSYVIRELPVLLKSVACLGYCALPEVQRRIGIEVPEAESAPSWLAAERAP